MRLAGKVALVTGCARGIGCAICEAYASARAKIDAADLLEDDAKSTVEEIGNMRHRPCFDFIRCGLSG